MKQKVIVVALGGNALGKSPGEQKEKVKSAAQAIVELVRLNYQVVVCHGNGPQVGLINKAFTITKQAKEMPEVMPFAECGAMSQGYIGYHLQNAIQQEVRKHNVGYCTTTLITQTIVDKKDPAFKNPTKPIGNFLTKDEADKMAKKYGYTMVEDAGRGYRRVVPSPLPLTIQEKLTITELIKHKTIVIAGGGGGIPVYRDGDELIGVDAVIDKDFTSAKLAEIIKADAFIILTAVPTVMINYNKPNQKSLTKVSLKELESYIADDQFAKGSMLPKIKACTSFVKRTGKPAYIGELKDAMKIIQHKAGTKISG